MLYVRKLAVRLYCAEFQQLGEQTQPMFVRRLSFWTRGAVLAAVLTLTAAFAPAQQKLPDAPTPQNNAPVPSANVPPAKHARATRVRLVQWKPGTAGKYSRRCNRAPGRPIRSRRRPVRRRSRPFPPGSVPSTPENGRDQLITLEKTVSFVTVPVTVKDNEGKLIEGLLAKDFSIYENGTPQRLTLLHQRSVSAVGRADH